MSWSSRQWMSLWGPVWACSLWMGCEAYYGPEPWYIPNTWDMQDHSDLLGNFKIVPNGQMAADPCSWVVFLRCWPSEPKDSCWFRLPLNESADQRWTCPLHVRYPPDQWVRICRASLLFLRRMIWKTAWLRDEWALAEVWPEVLKWKIKRWNLSQECLTYTKTLCGLITDSNTMNC